VSAYAARRQGLLGLGQDARATAMVALSAGVGLLVGKGIRAVTQLVWVELLAVLLATTICWLPLLWPIAQRLLGRMPLVQAR
jgi:hypothetical protein